jgi:hypothetical protein
MVKVSFSLPGRMRHCHIALGVALMSALALHCALLKAVLVLNMQDGGASI